MSRKQHRGVLELKTAWTEWLKAFRQGEARYDERRRTDANIFGSGTGARTYRTRVQTSWPVAVEIQTLHSQKEVARRIPRHPKSLFFGAGLAGTSARWAVLSPVGTGRKCSSAASKSFRMRSNALYRFTLSPRFTVIFWFRLREDRTCPSAWRIWLSRCWWCCWSAFMGWSLPGQKSTLRWALSCCESMRPRSPGAPFSKD